MYKLTSDEQAVYYLQGIKTNTLDEAKENIYMAIKESKLEDRTKYFFTIIMKETNEYVGEIGYTVTIKSSEGMIEF